VAAGALLATGGAAYQVTSGDTLSAIAQRFGTSVSALVDANDIADPNLIYVGQSLVIPGDGATEGGPATPTPAAAAAPSEPSGRTHVVTSGESLASIASRYGLTVEQLARANGIVDPNRVLAGSLLRVAADAPPPPGGGGGGTGSTEHTITAGETLSSIAGRYGTTVAALVDANDLANPDRIIVGHTLTIPGTTTASGWTCPVPGATFVNDFGVAKPDGRFHEGIDMHAPQGTIIRAPVSGIVEHIEGSRGGLQFNLHGDDGYRYFGAHLDSFGEAGRVAAGDPLGQVGTTGNAIGGPPHLHFEMHYDGLVNPYPTLVANCR
jgi:LysM repeat protein